jgi:hypothetical protein
MAKPGQCDPATNAANKNRAYAENPHRTYAPVTVTVISRTDTHVTFTSPGDSQPGRQYTVLWGDKGIMWAACPSNLPSQASADDPGPPPGVGDSGELLLSESYLSASTMTYPDPKWPAHMGAGEPVTTVRIALTRLFAQTVHVTPDGTTRFGKIDLLDLKKALRGQTLPNDGSWFELKVTEAGRHDLGADPALDD